MTRDEVDAFFAASPKRLPAVPTWRETKRKNDYRARIPVEAGGRVSGVELEIKVQLRVDDALIIVLLAPACVARLCLGTKHMDRITRTMVFDAHFHPWETNRATSQVLPAEIPSYEIITPPIISRDEAFAWFLNRIGIESPSWLAAAWPDPERLL